ncbi:TfuA-like protein [Glycomyces sp. YM15]|uniref:TfuA-like protein n=1 Tax=Glycomyces sp. YM15 TaxID=2800446 RepID=UPI00196597E7|nr:TfuA-like protein [Glycomyces sp. YM15]
MTRYLFVGPSLPDAALLTGNDIVVRPPVAAGDLLRLGARPGDVVGIVDGYFHQTRSVRHKEILDLLDAGVTVLGASSMGALRAAELDVLGMGGIGGIYRAYRLGELIADDEVALVHGPADEGYPAVSEPLVNIRATLDLCIREGVLDTATAEGLVTALAHRPYRLRSYPDALHLARRANVPDATLERLRAVFATRAVNRKREDALRLIGVVRRLGDDRPGAARPRVNRAPTVFLHRWRLGARSIDTADGPVAEMSVLRACQLFASDYPAFQRELVFDALARECTETCGRSDALDLLDAALAHAQHRGVIPDLRSLEPGDLDFLDPWLTPAERTRRSVRDRLAVFLVRSFQIAPGIPPEGLALDRLRSQPLAAKAARVVSAAAQMNEQARQLQDDFDIHSLSADRILSFLAGRWGTEPEDLELRALDRGIASLDVLVAAARPYYLLAKYNPDLVDLRVDAASGTAEEAETPGQV